MVQMLYVIALAKRHLFFKLTGPFGGYRHDHGRSRLPRLHRGIKRRQLRRPARCCSDDVVFSFNGGLTLMRPRYDHSGFDRPFRAWTDARGRPLGPGRVLRGHRLRRVAFREGIAGPAGALSRP